jgi:hypothetical protein
MVRSIYNTMCTNFALTLQTKFGDIVDPFFFLQMSPNDSNKDNLLNDSVTTASLNSNNATFWKKDWSNVQSSLSSLRCLLASFPSSPLRIMRVSQLDADLLDSELFETFKEQLWLLFDVNIFFIL